METSTQSLTIDVQQIAVENFRRNYCKPELKELGDLRTLTLGGSRVGDDSAAQDGCHGEDILQPYC